VIAVAIVLVLGLAVLLRRVNSERANARPAAPAPVVVANQGSPNARVTPVWRADLDDEPSEDQAYKADPLSPLGDTAEAWAQVDFDEIRKAMPDNLYWKMAFPTKDPDLIKEREERRAQWNVEYGKVLSNTATDQEIDAYYGEQQKLSNDYLEFLVYLGTHYGNIVPKGEIGMLKLAGELHLARLEEIPRKIAEAKERHAAHEAARRAWLEEQKAFEDVPRGEQ
jgi:antitoxin (DNA-binding transcriptional repressor) of toxin-antitoxin stability system